MLTKQYLESKQVVTNNNTVFGMSQNWCIHVTCTIVTHLVPAMLGYVTFCDGLGVTFNLFVGSAVVVTGVCVVTATSVTLLTMQKSSCAKLVRKLFQSWKSNSSR